MMRHVCPYFSIDMLGFGRPAFDVATKSSTSKRNCAYRAQKKQLFYSMSNVNGEPTKSQPKAMLIGDKLNDVSTNLERHSHVSVGINSQFYTNDCQYYGCGVTWRGHNVHKLVRNAGIPHDIDLKQALVLCAQLD